MITKTVMNLRKMKEEAWGGKKDEEETAMYENSTIELKSQELLAFFVKLYHEKGFNVVPLKPNSKQPAISWKMFTEFKQDENIVNSNFWKDNVNIAVVCGRISNNLFVVDCENEKTFNWFKENFPEMVDTYQVKTRRGIHLYYQVEGELEDEMESIQIHNHELEIDILGDGRLATAPPSVIEIYTYTPLTPIDKLKKITKDEYEDFLEKFKGLTGRKRQTQTDEIINDNKRIDLKKLKNVLMKYYKEGSRQNIVLYTAGMLRKEGVAKEDVIKLFSEIWDITGDEEVRERISAIELTYEKDPSEVAGFFRLCEFIPEHELKECVYETVKLNGRRYKVRKNYFSHSYNKGEELISCGFYEVERENYVEVVYYEINSKGEHKKLISNVGVAIDILRQIEYDYDFHLNNLVYEYVIHSSKAKNPVRQNPVGDKVYDENDWINEIYANSGRVVISKNKGLYKDYLNLKLNEFWQQKDIRTQKVVSKTGWNEDFTQFYHPSITDEGYEFSKKHILVRKNRNIVNKKDEQHEFVKQELSKGTLLGLMYVISTASLVLEPFELSPITVILTGNSNAGKSLVPSLATSLFYQSKQPLITANTTINAFEFLMRSLYHMPIILDEGALGENVNLNIQNLIFMVSSGLGKGRGQKDKSVDLNELRSNIFYTSETLDTDQLTRAGAWKRMLHFSINNRTDFTDYDFVENYLKLINMVGAGVDYIKYLERNLNRVKEAYENTLLQLKMSGRRIYTEMYIIINNLFAGLTVLENYYNTEFVNMRKTINDIITDAYIKYADKRDNKLVALHSAINENALKFYMHKLDGERVVIKEPKIVNGYIYGAITDGEIRIYTKAFHEICKNIGVDANIMLQELKKHNLIIKYESEKETRYSYTVKIADGITLNCYRIKREDFEEYVKSIISFVPDDPGPKPDSEKPKPEEKPEPEDDILASFFCSDFMCVKMPDKTKSSKEEELKQIETSHTDDSDDVEVKEIVIKQVDKVKNYRDIAVDNGKKIIIDEDRLDIFAVKSVDEIKEITVERQSVKPFDSLTIACFDIETTTLNPNDKDAKVLAIMMKLYKDNKEIDTKLYTIDQYTDEKAMITAFINDLYEAKPDIVAGYNILEFDLPYLADRLKDESILRLSMDNKRSIFQAVKPNKSLLSAYPVFVKNERIQVVDVYALILKYDEVAREMEAHDLKYSAKYFGVSTDDRVILSHEEIKQTFYNDRKTFMKYLSADVDEAYKLLKVLYPRYYYLLYILPFKMTYEELYIKSYASMWENLIKLYYPESYYASLEAEPKKRYDGGLVMINKGLYRNVYKIDISSMYPNIMLNYRIHSKKDKDMVQLSLLKAFTRERLELKKRAKNGDKEADLIQNALKVLINSGYGFLGTELYKFNDMVSAAGVTAYGRLILKYMIQLIQKHGGYIIECDTDGIFFTSPDGEAIFNALAEELKKINFSIELEVKNAVMFASHKKNYILYHEDGKITKKGIWRSRNKSKLVREWAVEYIKTLAESPERAKEMEKEMRDMITSGKAWDWLCVYKTVGKNDISLLSKGYKHGDKVRFCYLQKKSNGTTHISLSPEQGYDVKYYLREFEKLVRSIKLIANS